MKSIKPGRGPSGMSFIGSVVAVIFGVFWTVTAFSITANAPFGGVGAIFPLFGVIFIIVGIVQAAYHFKNATGKDRFSEYDITDPNEEGDPSDQWIRKDPSELKREEGKKDTGAHYCPYCGAPVDSSYAFCPNCGKAVK